MMPAGVMRLSVLLVGLALVSLLLGACGKAELKARVPSQEEPAQAATPNLRPEQGKTDEDWLLAPPSRVGPITPNTSRTELEARFGKTHVKTEEIYLVEGEAAPGVVLFPDVPQKRIELTWKDARNQSQPELLRLNGEKSLWHTQDGITLGTTLADLEKLNGGPFKLNGFSWDYGGIVVSWGDHGKLRQRYPNGTLLFRLDPGEIQSPTLANQVMGDRVLSSDLPAMRQINPKLTQLTVVFP